MKNKIDLEKIVNNTDNNKSPASVAFKIEICTILANADIWITVDVSIDDFHNKCDFEKLAKLINWGNVSIFGAFDGNDSVRLGNLDLDSFKEALNASEKIFLQIGSFKYDESQDEPCFIFDEDNIIDELEYIDECYEKYKSDRDAGYGIYLDRDLNVEYGYYTTEAPPSGHGAGYTTIHDFKDAIEGDKIKEKISSLIDDSDIWVISE